FREMSSGTGAADAGPDGWPPAVLPAPLEAFAAACGRAGGAADASAAVGSADAATAEVDGACAPVGSGRAEGTDGGDAVGVAGVLAAWLVGGAGRPRLARPTAAPKR